jgi:uncharacterized repeat protein (TIGR03847 family)
LYKTMPNAKLAFTNVTRLQPESLGEPGKRTFRILVDSGSSSASIWLEKEQLFELAIAVQRLIATLSEEAEIPEGAPSDAEAPGLTSLDFQVGRLVLGHDSSNGLFIIDAYDVEEDEGANRATIRVWANKQQISDFAEVALRVCASGRPLCPLCGRPINAEGHQCIRTNGHRNPDEL